jgi:protein-L-isoaspartate(D-aspartate) O-methyltransferase
MTYHYSQELYNQLNHLPGVKPAVVETMARIPREDFTPRSMYSQAYRDVSLPIGYQQTISAPSTVAKMVSYLDVESHHSVLEIGTGSGYQTIVLGKLAKAVYSLELIEELYHQARRRILYDYKQFNVFLYHQDGWRGMEKHAPFDRIIICAALNEIPTELCNQMEIGGKLIMPFGDAEQQLLIIERTHEDSWEQTIKEMVHFVPFLRLQDVS